MQQFELNETDKHDMCSDSDCEKSVMNWKQSFLGQKAASEMHKNRHYCNAFLRLNLSLSD